LLPATGLLPGTNALTIDSGDGSPLIGSVTNWLIRADPATAWENMPLAGLFNDRLTQVFQHKYLSPRSPFCSLAIPTQGIGSWCRWNFKYQVDDSGLRKAAAEHGGQIVLPQGVPLATPGAGDAKNVAFTSVWENFPRQVEVPLTG